MSFLMTQNQHQNTTLKASKDIKDIKNFKNIKMDPPTASLLEIPLELRLMITLEVFRSAEAYVRFDYVDIIHKTENTSLVRTCRKLYEETLPQLAPNILLHFNSVYSLLTTLMTFSSIIENVRHIRIVPRTARIPYEYTHGYRTLMMIDLEGALSILTGLKLDVLTVEDQFHSKEWPTELTCCDEARDGEVHGLTSTSGWKKLRYISPTTEFVGCRWSTRILNDSIHDARNEDPLEEDGNTAHVRMYIANEKSMAGWSENVSTRSEWKRIPHNEQPDWRWLDDRELMLEATRRTGENYVQDSSHVPGQISSALKDMGWFQMTEVEKLKAITTDCDALWVYEAYLSRCPLLKKLRMRFQKWIHDIRR